MLNNSYFFRLIGKISFITFFITLTAISVKPLAGENQPFNTAANVSPSLSLSFTGLRNYRGRQTFIFNDRIDFGEVSFINYKDIDNGDAFLENQYLILDAVIGLNINGSGYTNGQITANRKIITDKAFDQVRFSTHDRGTANSTDIPLDPNTVRIKTFDSNVSQIPLRFLFYINRSQTGRLSDTVQLTINAI